MKLEIDYNRGLDKVNAHHGIPGIRGQKRLWFTAADIGNYPVFALKSRLDYPVYRRVIHTKYAPNIEVPSRGKWSIISV